MFKTIFGNLFGKKQSASQVVSTSAFAEEVKKMQSLLRDHNGQEVSRFLAFIEQSLARIQKATYRNRFPLIKNKVTGWSAEENMADSFSFMINILKQMNENAIPFFTIIATTSSKVTEIFKDGLIAGGYKPEEIACLLAETTDDEKSEIKKNLTAGKYRFLLADGYLLDTQFHLGTMEVAVPNIVRSTGADPARQFQANLFILNPAVMKTLQIRRAVDLLENSFTSKEMTQKGKISKDTIILSAMDVSLENERMRAAVRANNNLFGADLVKANLPASVQENDCQELMKILKLIPIQSDQSAVWSLIESAIRHIEPIAMSSEVKIP